MEKSKVYSMAMLLGIIPWIAYVIVSPFLNKPGPLILGMPPLMFWNTIWLIFTSLCLYGAYKLELGGGLLE
ncbi:DUF3311 domain-containing protein [Pyrococcus horikoshii]|uniref:DUF3311 domain-containing protein n=1 Tax=Pyrococcus horikoshii TaxID=53953 RepID=A0A832TAU7_PYRHR|nr:DUF3311 domain-containing protein [Pyrococcus horikoshii]HII61904.1 DUF3311 domain-containing protein [Pyrococcus horikoshii]